LAVSILDDGGFVKSGVGIYTREEKKKSRKKNKQKTEKKHSPYLSHELVCDAEPPVWAQDGKGSDVAVRVLARVLLHLGQHVPDNLPVVVLGDIRELQAQQSSRIELWVLPGKA
jgi:hypothetical protein